MVATACPAADSLRDFVLGQITGPAADSLEAHLAECANCARTIEELDGEDGLVVSLRTAGKSQLPRNALIEQLRLKMRAQRRLPASHALTIENIGATAMPFHNASLTAAVSPAPPPLPAVSTLPHHVGRYRILGRLGAGGMGTVYKAHDPQLNRVVAVKVPRFDGPVEAQEQSRQRFIREARVAAGVRHPHVCPLYDVGEQDGLPYVVMAFVDGESLADRLKDKGRFEDCREAVALIRQVGEGLAAVHAVHIVHRDMKPGNILLDRATGQPMLTDFGLARNLTEGENLTADGSLLGTPAYMSPEQATQGGDAVGAPSDQYSLAVVLYQMVTGRMPFEGPTMSVLNQIGNKVAPAASLFRPGLDAKLEAVLRTAMARKPEERYPTVQAFVGALTGWLRAAARDAAALAGKKAPPDQGITIPPLPGGQEGVTAADGTMALTPSARGMAAAETVALSRFVGQPRRRRIALLAVAAGLLLAATGVAGWFLFHKAQPGKDEPVAIKPNEHSTPVVIDADGNPISPGHIPKDPEVVLRDPVAQEPARIKGVTSWIIVATDDRMDGPFDSLALSRDGSDLLLRKQDSGTWIAWSLSDYERRIAPFGGNYNTLSANGQRAVRARTSSSGELGFDTLKAKWETTFQGLTPGSICAGRWMISPNGEWVASIVSLDAVYRMAVWSLRLTSPVYLPCNGNNLQRTAWGRQPGLLTVFNGNDVQLQKLEENEDQLSFRLLKKLVHDKPVYGGAFSPDGTKYASVTVGNATLDCWIWDIKSEERRIIRNVSSLYNPPAWSPSGGRLACPLSDPSNSLRNGRRVGVFDAVSGEKQFEFEGNTIQTRDVLFTADARTLITTGADRKIRFWDASTGSLRGTLILLPNNQWLAYNPEGHYKYSSKAAELKLFKFKIRQTNATMFIDRDLADFEREFGWKNDPSKVDLLGK